MRLIELGLAGVWFSSVSAFTVSATFIPKIRDDVVVSFCQF